MRPITKRHSITVVRTDALFVSALQPSDKPRAIQVRQAVAAAVRRFGPPGCAEWVAQEFGDHPEIAAARMRWARLQIAEVFGTPALRVPTGRHGGRSGARAA